MSIHSLDRVFPYISLGNTGTGAPQTITHNLQAIPDYVLIQEQSATVVMTIGAKTNKTIVVTIDNGVKFDLYLGVKG
jgi:hypothetical protein